MRCILCLAVLLSSIYGCKRTSSETKGWGSLGKKAAKVGNLSDEVLAKITSAVKKSADEGEVDDLKKLIDQGGKVADEAILAYRRLFSTYTDEWLEAMGEVNERILLLKGEIPFGNRVNKLPLELQQEIRVAEHYTDGFLDFLEVRLLQIDELADGSSEIADKLCCNSINFAVIEKNLVSHSGKLADDFDYIKNILKAEQDFLDWLRQAPKQVDQASKSVSETASTATQQLSDDVNRLISNASNDSDFVLARLAIEKGIKNGKHAELRVILDDLLANNPAKIDQLYQSFTNRHFTDIEHALSQTIPNVADSSGLYRALEEVIEDTRQLHKKFVDRGNIFKEIVNEDKLKVLQDNNRRYMAEGSTLRRVPLRGRKTNQHWLEQLPAQLQAAAFKRLASKDATKINVARGEVASRIKGVANEVKAIKASCKGGLC